ncbi:hypothetical protein L3X37_00080 [Sabulilitoribacter arenilitoris]|uniref:Uncharacterized protein n=1 Tax=Wocania arenilitoris TaxID=2044858 RepID=A0AAE3EK63_9FLAO|nr:hypothetical protein [Wocania arenilitoris]MCF7566765.1 hypothetical protein [Wocania arenilitoris]
MSKDLPPPQQSEEVDLGQLFKLIGNAFERFFKFIGNILNNLFLAFVWMVFFLKKHFIKFVIAGIIGIALGILLEKTSEPVYKSYITVKQNYPTGENLYNSIAYYNDLVKQRDSSTLKGVLDIKNLNVSSILEFEVESIVSENDKLKSYDKYLKELDSTLASTIDYKMYIKNSKDHTHKYQQITIKSKERDNFKTVFDRIIDNIKTNKYFKREQTKDLIELKNEKQAINESLNKSDTLLSVYQKAIVKSAENNNDLQTKITIDGKNTGSTTKEFELYNKVIELRERVVNIDRAIADKEEIIEVLSSKQDSGSIDNRIEIFGKSLNSKVFYAIVLTLVLLLILLGLDFIKFLERFKEKI